MKKTTVPSMFTKNPPTTTTDTTASKEDKPKPDRLVPWVEKQYYDHFLLHMQITFSFVSRPKKVSDVAYQDEVVAVLTKCLAGSDVSDRKGRTNFFFLKNWLYLVS